MAMLPRAEALSKELFETEGASHLFHYAHPTGDTNPLIAQTAFEGTAELTFTLGDMVQLKDLSFVRSSTAPADSVLDGGLRRAQGVNVNLKFYREDGSIEEASFPMHLVISQAAGAGRPFFALPVQINLDGVSQMGWYFTIKPYMGEEQFITDPKSDVTKDFMSYLDVTDGRLACETKEELVYTESKSQAVEIARIERVNRAAGCYFLTPTKSGCGPSSFFQPAPPAGSSSSGGSSYSVAGSASCKAAAVLRGKP